MTIKRKLVIALLVFIGIILGTYIGGNLWFSLGMMPLKNQISREEKQFAFDFEKAHPYFDCEIYYRRDFKNKKGINIYYKLKQNGYFMKINKKALADSVFRSFLNVKQKYYTDSLFIGFKYRRPNEIGVEVDEYIIYGYKMTPHSMIKKKQSR